MIEHFAETVHISTGDPDESQRMLLGGTEL